MTLSRDSLTLKLAAAALAFAAVLLALSVLDRGSSLPSLGSDAVVRAGALPGATTDERVETLQAQIEQAPDDPDAYAQLGLLYLQKVRDTGDASFYARSAGAFREALRLDSENFTAVSGFGSLALGRHDFREALELGERARRINPTVVRNYGVIADAQIELGRYAAAERTLRRWVNLKPELSSYARVSYFRELHGDFRSALAAMELAVSAGGDSPENFSYVQTLVGNLHFARGAYADAARAYRVVLARDPGYPMAVAGLARIAAGRGDYDSAIRRLRELVATRPLPEYVIALAETEQAAGRMAAARRDYELVAAEARLLRTGGVNTDVELALFEADHGDPHRAVTLARRAWRAAPSVRSADAYSWALNSAGRIAPAARLSREAMRLGSRDPYFLYHAGMIARRAGRLDEARTLLGRLVDQSPRFHPIYAPRARRALDVLR